MKDDLNLYRAPEATLVSEAAPDSFLAAGITSRYFVIAGWCALVHVVGSVTQLAFAMTRTRALSESGPDFSALYTTVPLSLAACFVLFALKTLLTHRFLHARSNWLINCNIVVVILTVPLAPFLGAADDFTHWPWLSFFLVIFLTGVFSLWIGIRLVRLSSEHPRLKLLAWTTTLGGVLNASVVLFLVGAFADLASFVAAAILFFSAARELREAGF